MRCFRHRRNCCSKSLSDIDEDSDNNVAEPSADPESLENMTKAQLMDYANNNGVTVNSRMTKAQIRTAIEEGNDGNLTG